MNPRPLKVGPWRLADLDPPDVDAPKVFSCFHCGGGSSMGYRLAGFDVVGGVEIDPEMMGLYRRNLKPARSYMMSVQDFVHGEIDDELIGIDVLDGSPPCSSFSMAGAREKNWGKKKHFREGQAEQVLDDLFFRFIDVAKVLKPKFIVAENVKGLVMGKAVGYVQQIFKRFRDEAGYTTQAFLVDSSRMGVPQSRERSFFLCRRLDLNLPPIKLDFRENPIPVAKAIAGCQTNGKRLPPSLHKDWLKIKSGLEPRYHSTAIIDPMRPSPTLTTKCTSPEGSIMHWDRPRKLSPHEAIRLQTFPEDYDFMDSEPGYVMGMSVPPFMMQRVADQVLRQWVQRTSSSK